MEHIRRALNPFHRHEALAPANAFNTDVPLPWVEHETPVIPLPLHTSSNQNPVPTSNSVRNAAPQSPHIAIYSDIHAANSLDNTPTVSPIRSSTMKYIRRAFNSFHRHEVLAPANAFSTDVPLPQVEHEAPVIPLPPHTSSNQNPVPTSNSVRNAAPQSPHNAIYSDIHAPNSLGNTPTVSPIRSSTMMKYIRRIFNSFHRHEALAPANAFNTDVPLPWVEHETPVIPLPVHTSSNQNPVPTSNSVRNAAPQSPHIAIYSDIHAPNSLDNTPTVSPVRSSDRNHEGQSTTGSTSSRIHSPRTVPFPPKAADVTPTGTDSNPTTSTIQNGQTADLDAKNITFSMSERAAELTISGLSSEAALKTLAHMLPLLFVSKNVKITICDTGSSDTNISNVPVNILPEHTISSIQVQSLKWCGPQSIFNKIWNPLCAKLPSLTALSIDFTTPDTTELASLRQLIVTSPYLRELNVLSEICNGLFLHTGNADIVKNLQTLTIQSSRVSITNFLQSLRFHRLSCLDLGVSKRGDSESSTEAIVAGLLDTFSEVTSHSNIRLDQELRIVYPQSSHWLTDIFSTATLKGAERVAGGWEYSDSSHPTDNDWRMCKYYT